MANETDDNPIAHWAQAPRTRGHWVCISHSSQDLLPPPPYPVPKTTLVMPPEMIAAFKAMAQALQIKDKPEITVITFYERKRKSNVSIFRGETDPENLINGYEIWSVTFNFLMFDTI